MEAGEERRSRVGWPEVAERFWRRKQTACAGSTEFTSREGVLWIIRFSRFKCSEAVPALVSPNSVWDPTTSFAECVDLGGEAARRNFRRLFWAAAC